MIVTDFDTPVDVSDQYADADIVRGDNQALVSEMQNKGLMLGGGATVCFDAAAVLDEASIDPGKMKASFTIVTRSKDRNRNGNMVQIQPLNEFAGMKTDNWERNPQVLFNHGMVQGHPISNIGMGCDPEGKVSLRKQARRIISDVYFHQLTPLAVDAFAFVDAKVLKMASVGYDVELARRLTDKAQAKEDGIEDFTRWKGGWDFLQTELLEWSLVLIGADRDSFRQAFDKGVFNGQKLSKGMLQICQSYGGNGPAWSPGWTPAEQQMQRKDFVSVVQGEMVITGPGSEVAKIVQAMRSQSPAAPERPQGTQEPEAPVSEVQAVEQQQAQEPVINWGEAAADLSRMNNEMQQKQASNENETLNEVVRQTLEKSLAPVLQGAVALQQHHEQVRQSIEYQQGKFPDK